jgi:hypothetical protein
MARMVEVVARHRETRVQTASRLGTHGCFRMSAHKIETCRRDADGVASMEPWNHSPGALCAGLAACARLQSQSGRNCAVEAVAIATTWFASHELHVRQAAGPTRHHRVMEHGAVTSRPICDTGVNALASDQMCKVKYRMCRAATRTSHVRHGESGPVSNHKQPGPWPVCVACALAVAGRQRDTCVGDRLAVTDSRLQLRARRAVLRWAWPRRAE